MWKKNYNSAPWENERNIGSKKMGREVIKDMDSKKL